MTALVGVLLLIQICLAALVIGLLRSHASILKALKEIGVDLASEPDREVTRRTGGERVTELRGEELGTGDLVALSLEAAPTTLLAFLSSTCLTCVSFWHEFASSDDLALPGDARLIVVANDAAQEDVERLLELSNSRVQVILSSDAWEAFEVPGSPYFVLVDGQHGPIGEGTGPNWPQVRRMLNAAQRQARTPARTGR
jgi:hypothetical protein